MKSNYKIIPEKQLIIETLSKNISPNEYTKLKYDEFQNKKFNRNFNLITDIKSFNDKQDNDILNSLFLVFRENKGKLSRKRNAIIVSPNQLSNINSIIKKDKSVKSFTDIEDAYKWILE